MDKVGKPHGHHIQHTNHHSTSTFGTNAPGVAAVRFAQAFYVCNGLCGSEHKLTITDNLPDSKFAVVFAR
jgi:hypothetical protein